MSDDNETIEMSSEDKLNDLWEQQQERKQSREDFWETAKWTSLVFGIILFLMSLVYSAVLSEEYTMLEERLGQSNTTNTELTLRNHKIGMDYRQVFDKKCMLDKQVQYLKDSIVSLKLKSDGNH